MTGKSKQLKKYRYDYPENRSIGKGLSLEDRRWIAEKLGRTLRYINRIFIDGDRTNDKAIQLARMAISKKIEREKMADVL